MQISTKVPLQRSKWETYFLYIAGGISLLHIACIGAFWTGVRPIDWVVCFALYFIRMFAITGGYHRYFSHRTYKTSRWFQFILAFIAETSSQKGALWWASHHRTHHKESDTVNDVHSPIRRSFWYSHIGWLYKLENDYTDYEKVADLARYPELVFLNKNWLIPPIVLGVLVWLWLGWSGLFVGFCLSTVILWHGTFTINSLSHLFGYQDYYTGDYSRNNWWLAIITLGEGWHNNHHFYQSCTRQGFKWWQYDITYYILKVMSWVGLVWDLREPPREVVEAAGTHIRNHLENAKT
ncbi:MAG: acyl-CoA desaturase [Prochlorotrichaceae cyanobacterium]|jgi:stearoyl-CoA desaturase (delta-9 desaturase)